MVTKGTHHSRDQAAKVWKYNSYKKWLNLGLTMLFFVGLIGLTTFVSKLADADIQSDKSRKLASYNNKVAKTNSEPADVSKQTEKSNQPANGPTSAAVSESEQAEPARTGNQSTSKHKPACNEATAKKATNLYESNLQQEKTRHESIVSDLLSKLRLNRLLNPDWYQMLLNQEDDKHENILSKLFSTYKTSLGSAHCPNSTYIKP